MAIEKVVLTQDGRQKLVEELEYLQAVERMKVQEEIQIAKGFGDLSENAEYSAAREHQARVEGRILELQQMLHERGELHIEGSLGFREYDADGLRAAVAQVHGHLVFPVSHSLCSVQNKTYGFLAHVL